MISSLCGGTTLNPTLSVNAPPGTQFYNATPKPVPVVYGNAFVEGTIISDTDAEQLSVNPNGKYIKGVPVFAAILWQAISMGKILLNWIIADSKIHIAANVNLPYDPGRLNDGDPDTFNDFHPALYSSQSGNPVLLPYTAPLHGVAHYYYSSSDGLTFDLTNKVPKLQYDVTRVLDTGLSINGDDLPVTKDNTLVVSEYLTYACTFLVSGAGIVQFNCPNGIIHLNDRVVFLTPPVGTDLPSTLQANVPYYVVQVITSPLIWFRISATKFGPSIYFPDHTNTTGYLGSLILMRNNGNNPASVIWDLLVNDYYGLALDPTVGPNNVDINVASFQAVHDFFYPRFLLTSDAATGQAIVNVSPSNAALFTAGQVFYIYDGTNSEELTIQSINTGTGAVTMTNNLAASYAVSAGSCISSSSFGKPYGVNCSFQDKTAAKDMIKKICEWTDCILTLDNFGRFYLTVNDPARLTTSGRMGGAAGSPPQITTDDFDTFSPTINTFDDTTNEFRAKFTSFADSYATLEVFFRNEANIAATGTTRSKDYDLSGFIFPDILALRLFEIAKRESFPLITVSTVCGIKLLTALVNDIFRLTYPEYGIDDYFKITRKVLDPIDSAKVKVEWSQCPELMFDLNSTSISQAFPTVPSVAVPGGSLVIENLTFPAGTSLSTVRSVAYTTDVNSIVVWGAGQENAGTLVYDPDPGFANNGDYTIVGHNQVKLNPTTFANEIQANVLGLLNVDTY